MKVTMRLITALVISCLATVASAQGGGNINVSTVAEKEVITTDADGNQVQRLVPAENEKIVPGDEVIFTVTFTNISGESTDNVTITNPVPDHMRYVAGTAFGPGTDISFSVDGGQTYAVADELTMPDAVTGTRPATPDDYTHIRWRMRNTLQPGAKGFARFRAVLK